MHARVLGTELQGTSRESAPPPPAEPELPISLPGLRCGVALIFQRISVYILVSSLFKAGHWTMQV